ncbi:MAG: hypothetical protein ACRDD8_00385 [Bacteroidales bacterium]
MIEFGFALRPHYKTIFFVFYLQHLQHPPETLYGSGFDAVANGCKWLQMKIHLQRVIVCGIGAYMYVANVANETSNFGRSKILSYATNCFIC